MQRAGIALVTMAAFVGAGRGGMADAEPLPGLDAARSAVSTFVVPPVRVVWTSPQGVSNAEGLLAPRPGQPVLSDPTPACVLEAGDDGPAGVLLDFGRELQGHVELFTPMTPDKEPARVRVRFGESVGEAMAEPGGTRNAGNDHAIRDQVITMPWLGTKTVGPSGFRFVRIDAIDPGRPVQLTQARALLGIRDLPRVGSFRCSDQRLERIWQVGADTVHLCMQEYLWDGIKRDRLVWVGDMHPEVATIHAVFGFDEVVPRSLDLIRDITPVGEWMNGISSYSMWWVLIHEDLWMHQGDRDYLAAQQPYLGRLLERLAGLVGPDGGERIDGMRFLDWPSSTNPQGVTAGLQALLVMTLDSGRRLMEELGDDGVATVCREAADRARRVVPDANGSKSGAALQVLAGQHDPGRTAADILLPGGTRGVSNFYGFYVLGALAEAGQIDAALTLIRDHWGGMLDLGATTFWEDFDLDWADNAGRIDQLVPPGKDDVHGDYGAHCYQGYRHSLCHGWAGGPTAWLSREVLGVRPLQPGCRRVRIEPQLGSLAWAEGSVPTPLGPVEVRHERQDDGSVRSRVRAPEGVVVETVGTTVMGQGAVGLRCEWLPDPTGVGTRQPRLSWQLHDAAVRGARQTAYRLVAASERSLLQTGQADLWDSGRIDSPQSSGVSYGGRPLVSGQRVFWKVMTWDERGTASPWSETATWTMGLLEPGEWEATWISCREDGPLHADAAMLHLPPARHYRRTFRIDKPVTRALLHGTALGLVEWSIDGRRVGDHRLEPGWTDYHRRVPARTHDVTAAFAGASGEHCVGALVADGWYAGYVGYGLLVGYGPHRTGRHIYGRTPAVLCRLDLEHPDGTRTTVVTDESWQVSSAGPIREADLLMGETYDARREMRGWDTAGFTATDAWEPVIEAGRLPTESAPFFEPGVKRDVGVGFVAPAEIVAYAAPPIRFTEELPAATVREHAPGVFIFDFGQNFAGVVTLEVEAAAGTEIRLRHGEMLHTDGRLMTENLRRARATDTYVCRGGGPETWTPRFTYHGFQFVELTGLPAGRLPPVTTLRGRVMHNDTPLAGRFACSDEALTRFWRNTVWTQRANFIEVPTDCPQRDERLGWTGDAQVYARTATFNADVAAFFTKWIDDVREAQTEAGSYPDYCPYPFAHGRPGATYGTAWTDAGVIVPWTMWQVYGDRRMLERHAHSLRGFMEWRARRDPELVGVADGNPWGDWLNVREPTPIEFIDLCFHAQSARMAAEMAEALGDAASADRWRERFAALADAFRRQHLRDDGTVAIDTQSACVLALDAGLVPPEQVRTVADQLAGRISANGHRMATGFLGTKSLLPVLSAHGHHDLACRLFQSRSFPSWGYEVEQGANTVWERWDSFTREHGFDGADGGNNAAMNSFSHYAFGAVMEWAFRVLAGIDTLEPGYGRVQIRPRPPAPGSNPERPDIDWVEADYAGPHGIIASHWRRTDEGLEMKVRIPPNTTARVYLPAASADAVTESGRSLADSPGLAVVDGDAGEVVLEVGSGRYHFLAR
jgi:alpha-L-rhamnosidase